ncbi:MAG: hypothetical protein MK207_02670 [Saprospiraceae bacterium]|nr:hypothetical protein [Saprospiraceae bacterium]
MEDPMVITWWNGLCMVAFFNVCLLFFAYLIYRKKKSDMTAEMKTIRSWQVILATIYTLGCGFRSILPRGDLRRIVLVDSWISSVVIGRTVATIAELSFVAQWSFILYEAGKNTGNKTIQVLAKIPFPMIVIAEMFSWYACTTTNYIGSAIEESLWAIAAAITVYGFYLARSYYEKEQRRFLNQGILAGILYCIYMVFVDVPAYISKWLASEATGRSYKTVSDGFSEVCTQWTQTRTYVDWQYEMIWMSLYFSIAVWMSIYLINSPKLDKNLTYKEQ